MTFLPLCVGITECLPRENLTRTVAEEVSTLKRGAIQSG